jgi:hypothetical protein
MTNDLAQNSQTIPSQPVTNITNFIYNFNMTP